MKRLAILAPAVLLSIALAAGPLGADWVEIKTPNGLFTLDRNTGAVIGVDAKTNTATLYPKSFIDGKKMTVVGPVEIAAGARDVIFKQYKDKGYFLICFDDSPQIFVLNAKTLKIESKIAVKERVNSTIATGLDPEDPLVYYIDERSNRCGWISMKTRAWAGSAPVDDNTHMAVSADGRYMYCRDLTSSPTGFYCHRKVSDPATGRVVWNVVFHEHTSVPPYVPGPFGRYCAVGTDLYSADLKTTVAALGFTPACFFRSRPAIVGMSNDQVVAASYNTFKVFSRTALPAGFLGTKRRRTTYRSRHSAGPVVCMADDANKRVVLACEQRIMTRTLADLKVPDEPLLICDVKGPRNLLAGTESALTVAKLDKRAAVRLAQGPTGMTLAADKLTWTPGIDQVGPTTAVLEVSAAGMKVAQTIHMNVARSYVLLGLRPSGMDVSPDGKLAVVWTGGRDRWRERRQPAKVALVDLAKMRVVATKTLPYSVRTAAVDAHAVYVAPAESDRINALALKDLARTNYTLTDSGVTALVTVASARLVAATSEHGAKVYEVPKLKAVASPIAAAAGEDMEHARMMRYMRDRRGGVSLPFRVGDNWYAAGCLFAADLTTAKMFVAVGGLPIIADDQRRPQPLLIPLPWNRVLRNSELTTPTAQRIARFEDTPTAILPGAPVAASLSVAYAQGRRYRSGGTRSATLTLRELVSGKVVAKLPLMSGVPAGADDQPDEESSGLVAGCGRKVVGVVGDRLFVHALSAETLKQCPPPFDFLPLAQVPVLDAAKPTVIAHKTIGGAAPVEFELLGSQKQFDIDTKTGKVTIDSPALTQAALAHVLAGIQQDLGIEIVDEDDSDRMRRMAMRRALRYRDGDGDAAAGQTPRQVVAQAVRKAAQRFKAYTGKTPKGIPVLVPVRVAATDKHQQVASMQYQVVIDIPQADILAVVNTRVAKAKKQQELAEKKRAEEQRKYREEEQRRRAAYAARRLAERKAATQPSVSESEAIERLERRIEKLEAKLDILIELLGKRKSE